MAFAGIALVAFAIGATAALRFGASPAPAPIPATALFQHTFDDADGQPQAIAQWQGRLLVVNFWATWCVPCVEEMPDLQSVQTEYQAQGITVVGLAIDNPAAVKGFRDKLQLQLPLLVAGASGTELARQLGNVSGALPYTVLVDRTGNVVQSKLGRLRAPELRGWLNTHL